MPQKLKVFRTPIGFHDAYVAAPSQKAALAAWGSDANLFARGAAELVTDPALTEEPLANPGTVIRRARGSTEQHLAALPTRSAKPKSPVPSPSTPRRPARLKPRPSRARVDALEQKAEAARQRFETEESELREREKELASERRRLAGAFEREIATLDAALDKARTRYREEMDRWRG